MICYDMQERAMYWFSDIHAFDAKSNYASSCNFNIRSTLNLFWELQKLSCSKELKMESANTSN